MSERKTSNSQVSGTDTKTRTGGSHHQQRGAKVESNKDSQTADVEADVAPRRSTRLLDLHPQIIKIGEDMERVAQVIREMRQEKEDKSEIQNQPNKDSGQNSNKRDESDRSLTPKNSQKPRKSVSGQKNEGDHQQSPSKKDRPNRKSSRSQNNGKESQRNNSQSVQNSAEKDKSDHKPKSNSKSHQKGGSTDSRKKETHSHRANGSQKPIGEEHAPTSNKKQHSNPQDESAKVNWKNSVEHDAHRNSRRKRSHEGDSDKSSNKSARKSDRGSKKEVLKTPKGSKRNTSRNRQGSKRASLPLTEPVANRTRSKAKDPEARHNPPSASGTNKSKRVKRD